MSGQQQVQAQSKQATKPVPVEKKLVVKKPGVFDKYINNPMFGLGVVGVVNLLGLLLLFVYIGKLSSVSIQLNDAKNKNSVGGGVESLRAEVFSEKQKIDYLSSFFLDEEGLVDFIKSMDGLKKAGTIAGFTFANNTTVKDKTKNIGFPVVIEFEGDAAKIDKSLRAVQSLPYLMRSVNFEVNRQDGVYKAKLGGFLYVSEKFGKN